MQFKNDNGANEQFVILIKVFDNPGTQKLIKIPDFPLYHCFYAI